MTTRDPERIPVMLKELERVWRKHPDLRLAQLLVNVLGSWNNRAPLFYIEDDKVLKALQEWEP